MATSKPQLNVRLHPATFSRLEQCAETKRISKGSILELALAEWFSKECQPQSTLDARPPYNTPPPAEPLA